MSRKPKSHQASVKWHDPGSYLTNLYFLPSEDDRVIFALMSQISLLCLVICSLHQHILQWLADVKLYLWLWKLDIKLFWSQTGARDDELLEGSIFNPLHFESRDQEPKQNTGLVFHHPKQPRGQIHNNKQTQKLVFLEKECAVRKLTDSLYTVYIWF